MTDTFAGSVADNPFRFIPTTVYTIQQIRKPGPVVQSICPIWSCNFEPAAIGAKFVVSESGGLKKVLL